MECLPVVLRETLVSSIVFSSSFDKPPRIQLVVSGHTEEIVNLQTGEHCALNFAAASVAASSGVRGEMHVPALCNGHPGDFIWTLNGDHSHLIGYAPSAKVVR